MRHVTVWYVCGMCACEYFWARLGVMSYASCQVLVDRCECVLARLGVVELRYASWHVWVRYVCR